MDGTTTKVYFTQHIIPGKVFTKGRFQEIISLIKEAVNRLQEIVKAKKEAEIKTIKIRQVQNKGDKRMMKQYLLDITSEDLILWDKFKQWCKRNDISNLRNGIFRLIKEKVDK